MKFRFFARDEMKMVSNSYNQLSFTKEEVFSYANSDMHNKDFSWNVFEKCYSAFLKMI